MALMQQADVGPLRNKFYPDPPYKEHATVVFKNWYTGLSATKKRTKIEHRNGTKRLLPVQHRLQWHTLKCVSDDNGVLDHRDRIFAN